MTDLVQEPMNPRNFVSRMRQFIDKKKESPVIPVKHMPADMAKIAKAFQQGRR